MAIIPGSVPLTGKVAPTDTLDTFATHIDIYGEGGYMTVTDISERNAISTERRKQGMAVYVNSENRLYILEDGITDLDWKEFFLSSGDVYVILAGDITDIEAIDKLTDTIGPKTQFVWVISSSPSLTAVTVPPSTSPVTTIGDLVGIEVTHNSVLTDITFEGITEIWKTLDISYNSSLVNVYLSSIITMTSTDAIINTNPLLTTIDLSSITNFSYIHIHTNLLLTMIDFSSIDTIQGITIDNCDALISLDLSNLTTATLHPSNFEININSCIILDSIDLSDLVTCDININLSTLPLLNTLVLSSMTSCGGILMRRVDALSTLSASLLTETIGPGIDERFTYSVSYGNYSLSGSKSGILTIMVNLCNDITNITFSLLDSVANGIGIVNNPNLTSIDFSSLTEIIPDSTGLAGDSGYMGLVILSNDLLTTINFSLLDTIDVGEIFILGNAALTGNLAFPAMLTCSGKIDIKGNDAIASIDFPLLTRTYGIYILEEAITNIYFTSLVDTWDTTGSTTLGSISITKCDLLTDIDMSSLTTSGTITISDCGLLTDIDMSSLTAAGSLIINGCDALLNIDFSSLVYLNGDPQTTNTSIRIQYNDLLSSVDLSSVVTVLENVTISQNDDIANVDLSSLISGTLLTIQYLNSLVDIDLSSLVTLTSSLHITSNPLLSSVNLPLLTTVDGTIQIQENGAVTSVDLPSLLSAGVISIQNHNSLVDIDLSSLVTSTSSLYIAYNNLLSSVNLPLLTTVDGAIIIKYNLAATSIDLSSLISGDGVVEILVHPFLVDIDLSSLVTLTSNLYIRNNDLLSSVNLPLLTTVDGEVDVSDNDDVTSIDLPSLISVGEISIRNHNSLVDIDLSSLVTSTSNLDITGNPLLSSVNLPLLTTVDGSTTVENNGAVTSIDLPSLISSSSIGLSANNSLVDIDLSSLVTSTIVIIQQNVLLDVASPGALLPSLETAQGLAITGNDILSIVEAPVLDTVGTIAISENNNLTTVLFPMLSSIEEVSGEGYVYIQFNSNLTYIDIFSLVSLDGDEQSGNRNIFLGNNALTQANVDAILAHFVNMSPVMPSTTLKLGGGTNATPSAQGISDRDTLNSPAYGWNVTTN